MLVWGQIDERLSQGDPSPAVEDDEEEEEEEEMEDVGGRDQRRTYWADDGACAALVKEEEEERQSGQWQRSAPAHDDGFAAVEDNTGDADLDHAMAIAAAEVEVKMEQQAAGAAMEVTTEPAAAPSPSPPQPPPQPLLSPPLAPQPPRPPSCPIKPPPSPDHDRKPWDKVMTATRVRPPTPARPSIIDVACHGLRGRTTTNSTRRMSGLRSSTVSRSRRAAEPSRRAPHRRHHKPCQCNQP